jgi:hypothetical protein
MFQNNELPAGSRVGAFPMPRTALCDRLHGVEAVDELRFPTPEEPRRRTFCGGEHLMKLMNPVPDVAQREHSRFGTEPILQELISSSRNQVGFCENDTGSTPVCRHYRYRQGVED